MKAPRTPLQQRLATLTGWIVYLAVLMWLASLLPRELLTPGQQLFAFGIAAVGIWRYGLRALHFLRAMLFLHVAYPLARKEAEAIQDVPPPHAYLMVTSFRIDTETTAMVYRAAIEEAVRCNCPATVVASIVELSDEYLIRGLWQRYAEGSSARLKIVRVPGTGKRDGLAQGFRAISRDTPHPDAVVAVIDGDSLIEPGIIAKTAPYLQLYPNVGGLTTNEYCHSVRGSTVMQQWHRLRFAQRHLYMCSMALSRRVLTLTGRMSIFRAAVVTSPEFIADVERDAIQHWRLGRFRFLTGDDKSTWYSLMRLGYDTYYVPDAVIHTVETPPDPRFLHSFRQLMFRWSGNSLRQNSRATALGPQRLGWFTAYVLFDQRISMWTSLIGPVLAFVGCFQHSFLMLVVYLLWAGTTRLVMTLMLIPLGHRVDPWFPVLLWFNQVGGAVMKIYVFFRLDRQSWTRQKTTLQRDLDGFQIWFNRWSSRALTVAAAGFFTAAILKLMAVRVL